MRLRIGWQPMRWHELRRWSVEEQREKAAKEDEKRKKEMRTRMGALQVRGNADAAMQIAWMLHGTVEWRRIVLHNERTKKESRRSEWTRLERDSARRDSFQGSGEKRVGPVQDRSVLSDQCERR